MSQPYRVLVADDDPTVALLMPVALAAPDFSVTVVDSGVAAVAEFKRTPFDIVLLDVEMPLMNGFEVAAALRCPPTAEVLIVLVTGRSDPLFFERAAALGAAYIAKPVDWSRLATELRKLLHCRTPNHPL